MSDEIKKTAETNNDGKVVADDKTKVEGKGNAGLTEGEKAAEAKAKADAKAQEEAEKKRNAEQAALRREREKQEAINKAKFDTIIEITGGKNPFTDEDITDQADMDEYLLMKKIEKDGGDPIADYHKYLKQEKKKQTDETKDEDWNLKDWQAFKTKHPDITLEDLESDPKFLAYAEGKIGKKPLSEIYDTFVELFSDKSNTKAQDKEKAEIERKAREKANKAASPGSLKGDGEVDEQYFTMEQIKSMNKAQVKANFDKIQKSLAYHRQK